MSSPVTGDDFVVASQNQSFCERITNLLSLSSKMKLFFDWAFDSGGNPTQALKTLFLPPPGVIVPYYTSLSYDAAAQAVMRLDRTDADISANGVSPAYAYWVICDGSNGTVDIRGRVVVGAGQGQNLTNRVVGNSLGDETVTLSPAQVPQQDHFHGTGRRAGDGQIDSGNNDFEFIMRQWTLQGTYHYNTLQGDGSITGNGDFSSSGNSATTRKIDDGPVTAASAHDNMQPSTVLYYIMRTSRVTA